MRNGTSTSLAGSDYPAGYRRRRSAATLDADLVVSVLELYGIGRLWAAAGWFLESNASTFGVADRALAPFERRRPKSPLYLVRDQRGGTLASRWNLIVPSEAGKGDPDGGES